MVLSAHAHHGINLKAHMGYLILEQGSRKKDLSISMSAGGSHEYAMRVPLCAPQLHRVTGTKLA